MIKLFHPIFKLYLKFALSCIYIVWYEESQQEFIIDFLNQTSPIIWFSENYWTLSLPSLTNINQCLTVLTIINKIEIPCKSFAYLLMPKLYASDQDLMNIANTSHQHTISYRKVPLRSKIPTWCLKPLPYLMHQPESLVFPQQACLKRPLDHLFL